MIGIDIVRIARLERLVERFGHKALERFLSKSEIALCLKSHISESSPANTPSLSPHPLSQANFQNPNPHAFNISRIAGFWAAKEACSKALGTGIGRELEFLDICIGKDSKGAPTLTLTPHKMREFHIKHLSLSISHDGGFAIAAVMVEH